MGDAWRVAQGSTGARGSFARPPREALSYGASGLLRNEDRSRSRWSDCGGDCGTALARPSFRG